MANRGHIFHKICRGKLKTYSSGYIIMVNKGQTVWDLLWQIQGIHFIKYVRANRTHTVWDISWQIEDTQFGIYCGK